MLKKSSFHRITSSGNYIPEIDGLRFIAISSVVLFHVSSFLNFKNPDTNKENNGYLFIANFLERGNFGVELFFVISGLVLGIPFAQKYLNNGKNVNLSRYFLRRFTRLEPPYFVVMIALYFASVFIAKTITTSEGIKSLGFSLAYSHNIVYGRSVMPLLNAVAWSLEIEIQFYILAPLLSKVFKINSHTVRRAILILVPVLFIICSAYYQPPFISIYDYFAYFMIGFLLADFYCFNNKTFKNKFPQLISALSFIGIWLFDVREFSGMWLPVWKIAQLFFVFIFYYQILFLNAFKWVKIEVITIIGGMCYSIYLIHYPLISLLGNILCKYHVSGSVFIDNLLFSIILVIFVLCVSSIFFILIERPCMKKYWYKDLLNMYNKKAPLKS